MTLTNTPHDFRLITADMQASSSTPQGVLNILEHIIEVVIYENLDRSFLTGTIVVADGAGLYQAADFKGVERIKLGFALPEKDDTATISRTFYIDKVISNNRANDEASVITLHLIEEIGYLSDYINVNRALYSNNSTVGVGTDIVRKLFKDYFNRDIVSTTNTIEKTPPLKVITPNWTPIESAEWVRNRMVDEYSSPYYLYSSFSGGNIYLQSLQDMLRHNTHHQTTFKYSQVSTNTNTANVNSQMFVIENYSDTEGLNMSKINDAGYVNSKFLFHDVNSNYTFIPTNNTPTVNHGAVSTSPGSEHWTAFGMMNSVPSDSRGTQTERGVREGLKHIYPAKSVLPWESKNGGTEAALDGDEVNIGLSTPSGRRSSVEAFHHRPESRVISPTVYSSQQFGPDYLSYTELRSEGEALQIVDVSAMRHWIVGDPVQITIPGRLFLMTNTPTQTSIGTIVDLSFVSSDGHSPKLDTKRSGRHLMYAAKHVFSPLAGYRVHATCVKVVANEGSNE